MDKHNQAATITSWILRIALVVLFLMSALPKLTGDPMAQEMGEQLRVGSWAVVLIGVIELIAAVLILIPRAYILGTLLAGGILLGAILSHLTILGISLGDDDGGTMFILAVCGLIAVIGIMLLNRDRFMVITARQKGDSTPGPMGREKELTERVDRREGE